MPNVTYDQLRNMRAGGGMPASVAAVAPLSTGFNLDGTPFVLMTSSDPSVVYKTTSVDPPVNRRLDDPAAIVKVSQSDPVAYFVETWATIPATTNVSGTQRTSGRSFSVTSLGSAAHTLRVEVSNDGTTWFPFVEQISSVKNTSNVAALTVTPPAAYVRVNVQNGNLAAMTGVKVLSAMIP